MHPQRQNAQNSVKQLAMNHNERDTQRNTLLFGTMYKRPFIACCFENSSFKAILQILVLLNAIPTRKTWTLTPLAGLGIYCDAKSVRRQGMVFV